MYTMISEKHNCDSGYIALVNIVLENMPESISVNGKKLFRKNEFHISIMALKHLAPLLDLQDVDQATEQLKQDFLDFQKTRPLTSFTITDRYRLVSRDERMSVVVMIDMPDIKQLFTYLRKKYSVNFPTQPAHITVYTLQPDTGIGILSQDELKRDSVTVTIPALTSLRVAQ